MSTYLADEATDAALHDDVSDCSYCEAGTEIFDFDPDRRNADAYCASTTSGNYFNEFKEDGDSRKPGEDIPEIDGMTGWDQVTTNQKRPLMHHPY